MCGIAGYVFKDAFRPADMQKLKAMTDIIFYRGPDDEGHYLSGPVALGHRRLSIIDLSKAGHQPMQSADRRLTIVFNGEIYNYIELREELKKSGSSFITNTDTEVLLEAYRHWGKECVSRFNGMWAFAIYDALEKKVFLSRDRFGIKPLYYLDRRDVFAFGSEIKVLLAGFPEEREVNEPFLHYFLPSGALDDGPETFFKNIKSLPPAHSAVFDLATGAFKAERYWDVDPDAFRRKWVDGKDPVEALSWLLDSSIELHMRSDVPVGTCLSGGLDSSTLVGLASRRAAGPMFTFSALYPDKDCDESEYVSALNGSANTVPVPIYPDPRGGLLSDLESITWHQDEPTAGPGLYTQFNVMKRACQDVKVLLDGQGGDELFAGYLPYFSCRIQDMVEEGGPVNRFKALMLMLDVVRFWGPQWVTGVSEKVVGKAVNRALRLMNRAKSTATEEEPSFFHPELLERVKGKEIIRNRPRKLEGHLNNTLYWHLVEQSIPALLHYEDRNSMAFSIEARVPLLDYRIVEFAMGLQGEFKIKGSWTKWVLREAGSRVLPPKVAWRRSKMGYPTPFARWIRSGSDMEDIAGIIFSESFRKRQIAPEKTVRFYYDQHISGKADRSWLLYRYVTLELWHRIFIDGWTPLPAKRGA